MKMKNAPIPSEIAETITMAGANTITKFEDKNDILTNETLHMESGFSRMENGNYFVSMYTFLPNATADMVNWFFWWHPQEKKRYQLWFPNEHTSIGYAKKDKAYFQEKTMPSFLPNTQYPVERIGNLKMPLSISFVTPETFGFDKKLLEENDVATVVCGHVGAFYGCIQHTEMAHIYFQKEDGLFLVSRFWLGQRLRNSLLRNILLTDATAKGMAEHCCIEYRNLANKLPSLYKEFYA